MMLQTLAIIEVRSVLKRDRQPAKNQTRVEVARQILQTEAGVIWFDALAVFFAGVFYFWAYYFWGNWWSVLTGG
jgi:hypothetical protein